MDYGDDGEVENWTGRQGRDITNIEGRPDCPSHEGKLLFMSVEDPRGP